MGIGDAFRGMFKKATPSETASAAGGLLGLGDVMPDVGASSATSPPSRPRPTNDSFAEAVALCRTRGGIGQRIVTMDPPAKVPVGAMMAQADADLARDPKDHIGSFNKGVLLLAGENPASAVAYFRTALDSAPGDEYSRAYYAHVLSLTDRHGEAVELVCDEIEQRPDVYRAVYTTSRRSSSAADARVWCPAHGRCEPSRRVRRQRIPAWPAEPVIGRRDSCGVWAST
jgi:hypothetical protein